MCGSTRYLRASTWSKYARVPTGSGECRRLQGRRFQYSRTLSIEVSLNGVWSVIAVLMVRYANLCRSPAPWRRGGESTIEKDAEHFTRSGPMKLQGREE